MAGVMNLRSLKFAFLRGSSAEKSLVPSFLLASWESAWLNSSPVKVWTVVFEAAGAPRALSWGLCVLVGAGVREQSHAGELVTAWRSRFQS